MSAINFRAAWKLADPALEREAKEYWTTSRRRLPPGVSPDDRARELCALASVDRKVVGVSTAVLEIVPQFRCRMAVYRCAVSLGLRHTPLSWRITEFSQQVLEKWSLENPDEKIMGLYAVIQSRELVTRYPQVFAPANMVFTGFSPDGFPVRVAWFKHAKIPVQWPPLPMRSAGPPAPGTALKASWGGEIKVRHSFET